jgi:predicted N-acyltransferase
MLPNYETTVIGPGRTDPHQLDDLLKGIVEWGQSAGMRTVAATYLLPHPAQVIDALRARDWSVSVMTHRCDMAVTWHDFDSYLATLPRKRRVAVRRELRALDEAGARVRAVPISAADMDDLVRLRLQLLAKYGLPSDEARESGVLTRLVENFDDEDLTVMEARARQRLLGYTLLIRDGSTWTALMTGTDYTDPLSAYCYFATCYYEPARRAPHLGVSRISYGMGSWEAKRLRGCALTPLYIGCRDLKGRGHG